MLQRSYSMGRIGPASAADLKHLVPHLRASDILELERFRGTDPREALEFSISNSKFAIAIRDLDGNAVSLAGVGWLPNPRAGRAWFVSSDALDDFALLFLQEVRGSIDSLMAGHDVVSNWVHAPNTKTLRWLRWLGFEEIGQHTSRTSGDLFLEMARFASPAVRDLYVSRDWSAFHATLPRPGT